MEPFGRTGKSPRRHPRQNLHPNKQMIFQAKSRRHALAAGLLLFVSAYGLAAQEKPDRPPWAQPTNNGQEKPSDAQAQEKSQEPTSPRGTIKVHVNLVNVLVSV